MNSEDMNEADLQAFLKCEDELSRRLKALAQPSPSAELDAAILARAEAQMAREQRPAAANDPSDGVVSKAPMARLGLRWRLPAGIAATVLAGVLAHQAWQASTDTVRVGEMPGSGSTNLTPLPAPAPQEKVTPAAPKQRQPAARRNAPAIALPPPIASTPEPSPVSPPPLAQAFSYSAPVPAAPPAPAASMMAEERRTVEVSASRRSAAVMAKSVELPTQQPDPKTWLAAIDAMLEAGLQGDAVEEWDKFHAAWPDYPVPAATRDKISALRK